MKFKKLLKLVLLKFYKIAYKIELWAVRKSIYNDFDLYCARYKSKIIAGYNRSKNEIYR